MVNLRVCVPDATENYVQNPAFRYNASAPWTAVGATLTRTLDYARFNIASCQVVTNGAALFEGAYYRVSSLSGISDVITVSVYVRGGSNGQKVRLRLQDDPTGFEWVSDVVELQTNRWKRIEVTGRCTGGNDIRLKVETADSVARAYTFYIDGAQMERKAYATTYCDGDQPGCLWNLTSHGSNSTRTADTREGGKWVALAGTCRPNNDVYVTVLGGLGMPPVDNITQPWSQSPGSYFQSQKTLDRVVTLNFTVKKESLRTVSPITLSAIHDLRQQLVDLFKTDKTLNDEAFLFEYSDTDADKPLYIKLRYEAGLEGSWDVRNGWYNTFAVRFLAVDPFWVEDTQEVKQLGVSEAYTHATNQIIMWKRVNMEWSPVTFGGAIATNSYLDLIAPDGSFYGRRWNGLNYDFGTWDGVNFTVLGVPAPGGFAFGDAKALAVGPDGTVYVGGSFAAIKGTAAACIAKYNPTTGNFTAMGTGLNQVPYTACVADNGQVYVGGVFTTAGGVNCYYIARWDGLQWQSVGATSGVNHYVKTIIKGKDNRYLYVCGNFTTDNGGGVTYNLVAILDTTTNLLSQMGSGFTGIGGFATDAVEELAIGLDGTIYAGGFFTASGADAMLNVASWNGARWSPLGSGLGGTGRVWALAVDKNGVLHAGGLFDTSDGVYIGHSAKWNGATWQPFGFDYSINYRNQCNNIIFHPNGNMYVALTQGGGGAPYNYKLAKVTAVTNPGTASCWPLLYFKGQGTLRYIVNTKTGQEIFLNLFAYAGEEIYIDFGRGKITSSVRGDMTSAILAGSEIRSIYLLPGENKFGVLVPDDMEASMQIRWQPLDWSADSIIDAAEMV